MYNVPEKTWSEKYAWASYGRVMKTVVHPENLKHKPSPSMSKMMTKKLLATGNGYWYV